MKRVVIFVLLLAFLLCACGRNGVPREIEDSSLFREREIQAAMDVVERKFKGGLGAQGCTILSLSYEEEVTERERKNEKRDDRYPGRDLIVILIDFHVDEKGGHVTLEPGQVYTNYKCTLTRNFFGQWVARESGYA